MNVNELFQALAVGELSSLSAADKDLGTIKFTEHGRFIRYLNDTLTMIYTRLAHKRDYVNFSLVEGTSTYALQPDLTTSLLKIIAVQNLDYEYDEDRFYAINDLQAKNHVKTLQYDTLFFPKVVDGQNISVEFQAKHPKIPTSDYGSVEIEVHPILESAVMARMASAAFMAMGGEDAMSKAQMYMNEFNGILQLTELEGMAEINSVETDNRFKAFGWR